MRYLLKPIHLRTSVSILVFGLVLCRFSVAQCHTNKEFSAKIAGIKGDSILTAKEKLPALYKVKSQFEKCNLVKDSVFARLLFFISYYEYAANRNYNQCLDYALASIKINTSGRKDCSEFYAMKSYYNVAVFYQRLSLNDNCLAYCDSALQIAVHTPHPDAEAIIRDARLLRTNIYFIKGDFQKYIEESMEGMKFALQKKDSINYLNFLNQKTFSLVLQNKLAEALTDLTAIDNLAKRLNAPDQVAFALKTKAVLYASKKDYSKAYSLYRQRIQSGIAANDYTGVVTDYIDWGNLYLNLQLYKDAQNCFSKASAYAKKNKDAVQLSTIEASIEDCSFKQEKYDEAASHCIKALAYLKLYTGGNILSNPTTAALSMVSDKDLIMTIMRNKAELLLGIFTNTKDVKYLAASIQTALVTDSLINNMRKGQSGEQSKLFWRDKTRSFYARAMEACFLAGDAVHAFFFMEKSRAVLLNDKLTELGAASHLPAMESVKEQSFQINIIAEQQKLSALDDSSKQYFEQQIKMIQAKNEFERYVKSLEQKYPVYYQYKYADEVPSLPALQRYVGINKQSFVHYFITDTAAYLLSITANDTKLIKLSKNDFNAQELVRFLQICSSKDSLNNHYDYFASLSFKLYKKLLSPLQLAKGRVIICQDNYLIPFEALCSDNAGKRFLLYDYSFSYVYSARSLINKSLTSNASRDFLGVAPVSFSPYLNVPDLQESADYLKSAADLYSRTKLLTNSEGSKNNFLRNFPGYAVVNIFSHASADSNNAEPYLYMGDSTLHLSEISLITKPAAQLVVLSACQTNSGKNAFGEGVYSLARGFAAVGIPSVAATLWNSEELSIYSITESFHKNISSGMNKDEALRQAKISFIQSNSNVNLLPYYWANMIIVGNTEPVKLSAKNYFWWWAAGSIVVMILLYVLFIDKKKIAV
ncbi:MAG: CHAT domain-containing protein [Ginsengibacter sp.]